MGAGCWRRRSAAASSKDTKPSRRRPDSTSSGWTWRRWPRSPLSRASRAAPRSRWTSSSAIAPCPWPPGREGCCTSSARGGGSPARASRSGSDARWTGRRSWPATGPLPASVPSVRARWRCCAPGRTKAARASRAGARKERCPSRPPSWPGWARPCPDRDARLLEPHAPPPAPARGSRADRRRPAHADLRGIRDGHVVGGLQARAPARGRRPARHAGGAGAPEDDGGTLRAHGGPGHPGAAERGRAAAAAALRPGRADAGGRQARLPGPHLRRRDRHDHAGLGEECGRLRGLPPAAGGLAPVRRRRPRRRGERRRSHRLHPDALPRRVAVIARGIAAALLAGAIVLYSAVALPMRRQAAAAADDYRRARDEARDMRARLARLERRDAAHLRAATALAGATPAGTVQKVRRSVVQTLLGDGAGGPHRAAGDGSRARPRPRGTARGWRGAGARRSHARARTMRGRVIAVAALAAALAFYLLREAGGPGPSSGGPDAAPARPPVTLVGDASAAPSPPLRNVFEYVSAASRPAAPTRSLAAAAPVAPAALASPPGPPPLRLVGLLRRGAQVKAALAIMGET